MLQANWKLVLVDLVISYYRSFATLFYSSVAGAILAAYGTLIFLFSIGGGSKAAEPEAAPAAAPVTGQGVPPVDSPEFEKFVADDAFVQLLENEDQLSAWVDEAK